jgi:hypothetical protein
MHAARVILAIMALLVGVEPALAEERGLVIRAGDLYAQPFIDAAKAGTLAPDQPVTIVERRGGWLAVDAAGKRGWVRVLNVRLDTGAAARPLPTKASRSAALRTGSSGRTVATGVKGLDEEDIRKAAIDTAQLALLEAQGASEADARQLALAANLKETKVDYLKKGKVR